MHHLGQKLSAVHPRHRKISNDCVKGLLHHQIRGWTSTARKLHLPLGPFVGQGMPEYLQHRRIVIHEQNPLHKPKASISTNQRR